MGNPGRIAKLARIPPIGDMLPRSFKAGKCKTSLKLAINRIRLLKNKKVGSLKQMRREVAQLLEKGQNETARIRVENVIQEEKTISAYEFIEIYCETVVARLFVIEAQRECPVDLKGAVATVIFASPRCADIPELLDVRKQLSAKYGKEFIDAAIGLRPDSGVDRLVVQKLSALASDIETKNRVLTEIAKEYNINWQPQAFHETIPNEPASSRINPGGMRSPSIHPPQSQEPIPSAPKTDDRKSSGPGGTHEARQPPDSRNVEETSFKRPTWPLNFKDAASAAHAAAEAADRASQAAKAAAELASPKPFPKSPPKPSAKPPNRASYSEKYSTTEWTEEDYEVDSENDQASKDQTKASRVSDGSKISGKIAVKSRGKIDPPVKEDNSSEYKHFDRPVPKLGIDDFLRNQSVDATIHTSRIETEIEKASSSSSGSSDPETTSYPPSPKKYIDRNSSLSSGLQVNDEYGDGHNRDAFDNPIQFDSSDSESQEHSGVDHFFKKQKSIIQVGNNPSPRGHESASRKDFSRSAKYRSNDEVCSETSSGSEEQPHEVVDLGQNSAREIVSGKVFSPTTAHSRNEERHDVLNLGPLTGGMRNKGQSRPTYPLRRPVNDFLPAETLPVETTTKSTAGTFSTVENSSPSTRRSRSRLPKSVSHGSDSDDWDDHPPAEGKMKISTTFEKQDANEPERKISYHEPSGSSSKKSNKETGVLPASYGSSSKPKQLKVPFFEEEEEEEEPKVVTPERTFRSPIPSQRTRRTPRTPVTISERAPKQSLHPQNVSDESSRSFSLTGSKETDQRAKIEPRSTQPPKVTDKQARAEPRDVLPDLRVEIEPKSTTPPKEADQHGKIELRDVLPTKKTDPQEKEERRGILPQKEGSSHVHPNLPDYESLAAHFRTLRSNRR